ncbi:MAG: hypothetical protein KGL39_10800 [Patescibacteria group bacterium]|nr:hypothetical protein [Patescibacteria group bacterium]
MSLYLPSAGGLQVLARALYGRGQSITAATNATPTVITSNGHGLSNGMAVRIDGATGNTNINGTFIVGTVATNTFQIYPTSQGTGGTAINGNGTFGGTCYWTLWGVESAALKLFSSNTTPAESDTAGTYTEVSNGSGYTTGGQTLQSELAHAANNVWAVPATVGSGGTGSWAQSLGTGSTNVPESTATALSWSWTGNVTAYGYVVVGSNSGTIWWSERFANPPKNFANGDSLTLTPRFGITHT